MRKTTHGPEGYCQREAQLIKRPRQHHHLSAPLPRWQRHDSTPAAQPARHQQAKRDRKHRGKCRHPKPRHDALVSESVGVPGDAKVHRDFVGQQRPIRHRQPPDGQRRKNQQRTQAATIAPQLERRGSRHSRIRDRVADVLQPHHVDDQTFEAETEAGMRHGTVAA